MKRQIGRNGSLIIAMGLILQCTAFGQNGTAVDRLRQAAKESRALAESARTADNKSIDLDASADLADSPSEKFPLRSHVSHYAKFRPWELSYVDQIFEGTTSKRGEPWPTAAEAADLGMLLKDADPALRGLAAEALATLYRPEDAPVLAALLGDTAKAAPILVRVWPPSSQMDPLRHDPTADNLITSRIWEKRTVASYARTGLKLITGQEFADEAGFLKWWEINSNARHCLWYWQQRIQREMDAAEQVPGFDPTSSAHRKQVSTAKAAVAKSILAELKQLPPEVEAKIRLLTESNHAGGAPITGKEVSFWPEPPSLRVGASRLLDLLDRKGLWEDVAWGDKLRGYYNLLAERLGMWAHVLFLTEDAPRLRAALENERQSLWWSGQAGLILGISRLSPVAKADNLDDAATRDGTLREAVSHESDLFVRDYCAMELVRVGLPGNSAFLKRMAFEPAEDAGSPTLSQAILQALAEKPLTEAKRKLLVDIVLDKQFQLYWTRPNARMGNDMDREYAALAINAHAGREVITNQLKYDLVKKATSTEALNKVRASIKKFLPAK